MNNNVSIVEAILQAEDIEGLLQLGAPHDEYFHEAELIDSQIDALSPDQATESHLGVIVCEIWRESFNLSSEEMEKRLPALQRVARQIRETCLQSA
jgi:hypothetical protein